MVGKSLLNFLVIHSSINHNLPLRSSHENTAHIPPTPGNVINQGPPALVHKIHHYVCSETVFPMDCSQPLTNSDKDAGASTFLDELGLLQQSTLAQGLHDDCAKTSYLTV